MSESIVKHSKSLEKKISNNKWRYEIDMNKEIGDIGYGYGIGSGYSSKRDEMKRWCETNINGRYIYMGFMKFRFENEDDMMAFRLTWC